MKPNDVWQLDMLLLKHHSTKSRHSNSDYVVVDVALKNKELVRFVNALWELKGESQVGASASLEEKRCFLETMYGFVEGELGHDSVLASDIKTELDYLGTDVMYDSFFFDDVIFLKAAFAIGL